MKTRLLLILVIALLGVNLSQPVITHGAALDKKVCKTVKKHGKKKKVCHTVKAAPKATPTSTPTNTPTPTSTPTPTNTPTPSPTPTNTPVPNLDASLFALGAAELPQGSQIKTNQIESNADADADGLLLHFGDSRAQQGRTTGYEMVTLQPNVDASGVGHPTLIYYLVSIFGTSAQARSALLQQQAGWGSINASGKCSNGNPGDKGSVCFDFGINNGSSLGEGFLVRGRVLVEVWNFINLADDDSQATYSLQLIKQAVDVLTRLERRAETAQGLPLSSLNSITLPALATDTPTATSTGLSQTIQVSANVTNPYPHDNSTETIVGHFTINGQGVAGLPMNTNWYYKTTTSSCAGTTDSTGTATCSRDISRATKGYPVNVSVVFAYQGTSYTANTSFTPQ